MADRTRDYDFADRMSDHESLMWNIEKDPWLNPSGASLTILDAPVDREVFKRQIRFGVAKMPRLYQRVVPGIGRLATPAWMPDPEFDFDYHVRTVDLPTPGTDRQLFDLAAQLYAEPLDRTRPLWRFVTIGGLEGGRGAIWSLFHHAISDGIGQIRMAELYQQLSRDEAPRPEVDLEGVIAEAVKASSSKGLGGDIGSSFLAAARSSASQALRRNLDLTRKVAGWAAIVPADPARVPEAAVSAVTATKSTIEQLTSSTNEIPGGSELWAKRSRHRHLEYVQVPLDKLKAAAKDLDGSVNDALLAVLTEAAHRYHAQRDETVEAFNTSFIMSTRSDNNVGGNSFTPVPVQLTGNRDCSTSFADRFADVQAASEAARTRAMQGSSIGNLSGIANMLPTSVVTRTARAQAAKIDFATSNLRGAPFELFCAGGRVLATICMGPLAGTPVNITVLSYNGMLDVGLFIDPVAIDDPQDFRHHVASSFADLLALHPAKKKTRAAKKPTKPKTSAKATKKTAQKATKS